MTQVADIVWPSNYNEIPKDVFVREDVFDLEMERIFRGPEWHAVAHEAEVPNVGDFKTFDLGDVPLIIVRGKDHRVRVLFNSCTHRGTQIEPKRRGNRQLFTCPYHRWAFSVEGDLVGCPNSNEFTPGFDKKDYPLGQPRQDSFLGLIFVTLSSESEPFMDYLGEDAAALLTKCIGEAGSLKFLGDQKIRYQSNWKGYMDGDGYHAPMLHAAFRLLNWGGGKGEQRIATKRGHRLVEADLQDPKDSSGFLADPSVIEYRGDPLMRGTLAVVLFPTFMVLTHLNQFTIRFASPRGKDEVEVHYGYYAHVDDDEDMIAHRVQQASNLLGPSGMVSLEDAAMFNRLHIGSRTPGTTAIQKGVKDPTVLQVADFKQNDESPNMAFWEYYRQALGFKRGEQ